MKSLLAAAEKLANDGKMPCRLTDWANDIYIRLTDSVGTCRTWELVALNAICGEYEYGIWYLAHMLDVYQWTKQ